ncbi:Ig-like domain-containing protein [Paenibacillus sp. MBLB4367]|uniref:Ig-like domain-containing protein n=1 Tax=Paenibacillus sp. MBLB4367 TaxID=3384767 RepID=UPI003907E90E
MKKRLLILLTLIALTTSYSSVYAAERNDLTMRKYDILQSAGIFNGYEDGSARLDLSMTREQFAAVIARLWKLDEVSASGYADVDRSRWSNGAIGAVTKAGFMNGVAEGSFGPEQTVTIEQLATILVRALGYSEEHIPPNVNKGTMSEWARPFVDKAVASGYISFHGDYRKTASRAELVESSFVAYNQLKDGSQPGPNQAATVVLSRAVSDRRIEVTFSDGAVQQYDLNFLLLAGRTTEVDITYKDKPYRVSITYETPNGGNTGTKPGNGAKTLWIDKVEPLTNKKVKLTLLEPVDAADLSAVSIVSAGGSRLPVQDMLVGKDRYAVIAVTDEMTEGVQYTLTSGSRSFTYKALGADKTKPLVDSVQVNPNATVTVTFNEPVDETTATDPFKYSIRDLTVLQAELAKDGKTVTLITGPQKEKTRYYMTIQGIADMSGNVMTPRAGFTFNGTVDRTKPEFLTVAGVSQTEVSLFFSERLSQSGIDNLSNYTFDNGLYATQAKLSDDGNWVHLTTTKQTAGTTYKVTVKQLQDISGNAMTETGNIFIGITDSEPPKVRSAVVMPDSSIKLTFSEKVTRATAENLANYTITNGVSVQKAMLDSDGLSVTLLTSRTITGTIYQLTVSGIADLAGNILQSNEALTFAGNPDNVPPVLQTAVFYGSQALLTFSEQLDPASAEDEANYRFDGGLGQALTATYNDVARTVTLTSNAPSPGVQYSLSVSGIKDRAGNPIVPVNQSFAAKQPLSVRNATGISYNSVWLEFNRDIRPEELVMLRVELASSNNGGSGSSGPLVTGIVTPVTDKRKVNVRFQSGGNPNPYLFRSGMSYQLKVSGPQELETANGSNVVSFTGIQTSNTNPYVSDIRALENASVRISFSQPVKNIRPDSFAIVDASGNPMPVYGDNLNDPDAIVSDVTLYLGATPAAGAVYTVSFKGITDASGLTPFRAIEPDSRKPYKVMFGGIGEANKPPKMVAAVSTDALTFDIHFSEAVLNADKAVYTLTDTTDGSVTTIAPGANAKLVASKDRSKVSVFLHTSLPSPMKNGRIYKIGYNPSAGTITDTQRLRLEGTNGANETVLAGNESQHAAPYIEAAAASGTTVTVLMSRPLASSSGLASAMEIWIDGSRITASAISADERILTFTIPAAKPGKSGEIRITEGNAGQITDYNGKAVAAASYKFTTN